MRLKNCITYIPTHPKHPMQGIRIALSNHHKIKRDAEYRVIGGEFIPWEFEGTMAALNYARILKEYIPLSDPKVVTYDEAKKYGDQECQLLEGKVQLQYLPN